MNEKAGQRQYKFSLSVRDKHNRQVKKIVDGLLVKGRGALSQSIRDGLRLLNDLRRGNTKVLLEMFPDIADKIKPPTPSDDDDLKRQIAELKRLILEQGSLPPPPSDYPQMKSLGAGIGSTLGLNKKLTLPTFDDDDQDTIVLNKAATSSNSESAMAALFKIAF